MSDTSVSGGECCGCLILIVLVFILFALYGIRDACKKLANPNNKPPAACMPEAPNE